MALIFQSNGEAASQVAVARPNGALLGCNDFMNAKQDDMTMGTKPTAARETRALPATRRWLNLLHSAEI